VKLFGYTRCFLASAGSRVLHDVTTFYLVLHRLLSVFVKTKYPSIMMVPTVLDLAMTRDLGRHVITIPVAEQQLYSEAVADGPLKSPSSSKLGSNARRAKTISVGNDFTSEQDRQLVKLKAEEKSWQEIAAELGKEVGEIKERWQKVRPEGQSDDKFDGELKTDKTQEANKKEKRKERSGVLELAEVAAIEVEPDEHFRLEEVRLHRKPIPVD